MLKQAFFLLRETVKEWNEDGATHIAAALAYYAIFSLSPLLIIVALLLGLVMDQQTAASSLVQGVELTLGQQSAQLIESLLQHRTTTSDIVSSIIWLSIVIWGASGMFAQLQTALNKIWEVKPRPGRSPLTLLKTRGQSFFVVVLAAVALLGTTVVNAALTNSLEREQPTDYIEREADGSLIPEQISTASPVTVVLIRIAQFILSVMVITFLIVLVFQVLPDVEIHWRDVIVGAFFTAFLLYLGQFAVGLYLSQANVGSVFGAAGSLTVILVWVYYTAQILLFGAEFTEVWARHHGKRIEPDSDAVWENEFKAKREQDKAEKRREARLEGGERP